MCMQSEIKSSDLSGRCYVAIQTTIFLFLLFIQTSCGGGGGGSVPVAALNATTGVTLNSGTTEVDASSVISISFTADMDPTTFNTNTYRLSGPDGAISGTVRYNPSTKTATFTPTAPLMPQATYTAVLTTDVKDKSGQRLPNNFSFTITSAKDTLSRSISDVIPPTLFGQHLHRVASTTEWPSVPFGTWRLWDASVAWPKLEPNSGEWHFEILDKYVELSQQHNVDLLLPLGLSPTWASARPTESSPYGLGNAAEPASIEDWKNYIRMVATRYKGKIRYYEIWNEVNIPGFYSGSIEMMVQLSKEAYQIIKAIDPTATVVSPSCVANDSRVEWFKEYLAKGGGTYADVISYHFYVSPNEPEAIIPFISKIKKIIADNALGNKPLWNTESGWYIENHNSTVTGSGSFNKVLTDNEASAYVARSYVLNWASGVNRFYWYAWDNGNMGLIERDGKTIKPPAIAYGEIFSWLSGSKMTSCGANSQGTWVVELVRQNGTKARIVWNPKESLDWDIPNEWSASSIRDLAGKEIRISAPSKQRVGSAPVLIGN